MTAPARKLRYAMVGGGQGAFIGTVHRKAMALDGQMELVAGAAGQPAERRCEGPIAVPCTLSPIPCFQAPVAQRTRAPDYESGGPRFESWRRHFRDVAQLAERPLWEREARGSSPRVGSPSSA